MINFDPGFRFVTYARVSSEAQNVTNSIETQLSRMEGWIKQKGVLCVGHYRDEAKTGKFDQRGGFQEMMRDSRKKPRPFDGILAVNTSRFARNNFDSTVYKHELKKRGVIVAFIDLPNDGSPEANLLEHIMQAFDAFQSDNQSRNIRHGNLNVVKAGFYLPPRPPYGYDIEIVEYGGRPRRKLIINEEKARNAQLIFDTYEDGTGSQDIHKKLNDLGIPSPTGGKWGKSKVYDMLRDPVYKGTSVYPKHPQPGQEQLRIDNNHPAIISPEQFDRIQDILDSRSPDVINPRQAGSPQLLAKLGECNLCTATMVPRPSKDYCYYTCFTRHEETKAVCDCPRRPVEDMDQRLMNAVLDDILTESNVRDAITHIRAFIQEHSADEFKEIKSIERNLADVETQAERLMIAYETGKVPLELWSKRMDSIQERKQALEQSRKKVDQTTELDLQFVNHQDNAVYLAMELKQCLLRAKPSRVKTWLRTFVKRVRFDYDKAIIDYAFPLPDDSPRPGATSRIIDLDDPVNLSVPSGPPSRVNSPYGVAQTSTSSL